VSASSYSKPRIPQRDFRYGVKLRPQRLRVLTAKEARDKLMVYLREKGTLRDE